MATARNYSRIAREYAGGVVSGEIVACGYVRKACQRQLDDLARPISKEWPYRFDEARAERICKFIELVPHVKGEWARKRQKLFLEPWQMFIFTTVMGWVHVETGFRRFHAAYNEVARKNGKSAMSAPLGLYFTCADGEEGAEVYSAATTRAQAKIVWETAKAMVDREAGMRKYFDVNTSAHAISQEKTMSFFKALSAEADTLDGLNVHCALIDELHAHPTRKVYDVLETATSARQQPLLWVITTAGSNRAGICYEQREYVTKILDGVVDDPSYFGIIYTLDDPEEWLEEKNWAKANPNLNISTDIERLRDLKKKAHKQPTALNNFLTKHMNIWVNANVALFDISRWVQLADAGDMGNYKDAPCWIGLDFAPKHDFTCRIALFRRDRSDGAHYYVFAKHFLSEGEIEDSANDSYSGWARQGWITTNPGYQTDDKMFEEEIINFIRGGWQIQSVCADPSRLYGVDDRVGKETGATVEEVQQSIKELSAATELLQALIADGKIHHDGDPVLTWMLSNVTGHYDRGGRIYPGKDRVENKIDGAIALITALSRAMVGDSWNSEPRYQCIIM